jgi:phosphatidylinositol-3-phosphatase
VHTLRPYQRLLAVVVVALLAVAVAAFLRFPRSPAADADAAPATPPATTPAASHKRPPPSAGHPTKVLTIVEENHSLAEMKSGMPYLWSLAQRYGYATNWSAITYPSLPNYLAIAGGSTFGVSDDDNPSAHQINAASVFDQALDAGKTAKTYVESMPSNCDQTSSYPYAVKHNPWAYFTPGRSACNSYDVPAGSANSGAFSSDVTTNNLPVAGMLIPNLIDDAHDGTLPQADSWLQAWLPPVLSSSDFTSGRLAVVITADSDDRSASNSVLTVVLDAGLNGAVVTTPLNHYSLTRFYAQTIGVTPLLNGATAPDLRSAFGM